MSVSERYVVEDGDVDVVIDFHTQVWELKTVGLYFDYLGVKIPTSRRISVWTPTDTFLRADPNKFPILDSKPDAQLDPRNVSLIQQLYSDAKLSGLLVEVGKNHYSIKISERSKRGEAVNGWIVYDHNDLQIITILNRGLEKLYRGVLANV